MLPPTPIRRLLLVPLVIVIAAALAALTPPVALLTAAFSLVRRRDRTGRVRRGRLLRVICLGLAWSAGETAALTVFLCLWIVSGFGGRLDTEPYQVRHYAVMTWFLDLVYRAARRACALEVTVTGPDTGDQPITAGKADTTGQPGVTSRPDATGPGDRPLIVLSRHAGPGDSLLLIHHLLSVCERRPRVVMKATLQLDPSVDILANRLPNAFLRRAAKAPAMARATASRQHVEQIRRLAAGMGGRSALVIFPEGGNWTPLRWRRGIDRLRRGGRPDLAERAAAMPNLLPPHGSGALAAITACPAADVIFVGHTGLDRLVSVRDVWQSLHADMRVSARWWRVPAASVPRQANRDAQVSWLYDWWERIDAWITAENQVMECEVTESAVMEDGSAVGSVPVGSVSVGTTPEGSPSEGTAPEGAAPEGAAPEGAAPEGAAPVGTAPVATAPVATAPVGSVPVGSVPVGAAPVGTAPVATAPVGSVPVGAAPEGTAPVATAPVGSVPVGAAPEGTAPVATAPVGSVPVGSAPVATAPEGIATETPATETPATETPATARSPGITA